MRIERADTTEELELVEERCMYTLELAEGLGRLPAASADSVPSTIEAMTACILPCEPHPPFHNAPHISPLVGYTGWVCEPLIYYDAETHRLVSGRPLATAI